MAAARPTGSTQGDLTSREPKRALVASKLQLPRGTKAAAAGTLIPAPVAADAVPPIPINSAKGYRSGWNNHSGSRVGGGCVTIAGSCIAGSRTWRIGHSGVAGESKTHGSRAAIEDPGWMIVVVAWPWIVDAIGQVPPLGSRALAQERCCTRQGNQGEDGSAHGGSPGALASNLLAMARRAHRGLPECVIVALLSCWSITLCCSGNSVGPAPHPAPLGRADRPWE